MKYLMLIKHAESLRSEPMPQALNDAMGPFVENGFKSGYLKDTAGLKGTAEGFRVRSSGGKLHVTDGPFTEAKEIIGGFWLWQCKSLEECVEWVKRCPVEGSEMIEIRRVFEAEDFGEALTPELRAAEDKMREDIAKHKK